MLGIAGALKYFELMGGKVVHDVGLTYRPTDFFMVRLMQN